MMNPLPCGRFRFKVRHDDALGVDRDGDSEQEEQGERQVQCRAHAIWHTSHRDNKSFVVRVTVRCAGEVTVVLSNSDLVHLRGGAMDTTSLSNLSEEAESAIDFSIGHPTGPTVSLY